VLYIKLLSVAEVSPLGSVGDEWNTNMELWWKDTDRETPKH